MSSRERFLPPALAGALLALAACGAPSTRSAMPTPSPEAGATGTITILHTNDFHGRYLPFRAAPGNATAQTGDPGREPAEFERSGLVGGFAQLATAVERLRRERGAANVLLLHGGDTFSDDLLGNRTRGEAMIRLMSALGYRMAALGNHDFDYGAERTRELQRLASFPLRGANVLERATGQPFLGEPFAVFAVGGVRVGVLALGYHNTHLTGNPEHVQALRFTDGIAAARQYVPRLRERADVVVVLSHQGTKVDELLAQQVSGIDVILAAHSHDRLEPPRRLGATWLAQAMSDAAMLGELVLEVRDGRVTAVRGQGHVLWSEAYPPEPRLAALIDSLRAPYRAELEERLAVAATPIGRQYRSESPFDKLVGRILREHTGAEIAMLPGVGYGVTLQPGPITREGLATLLPHSSRVVTLQLSGAQVRALLEQSATNQQPPTPQEWVGGLIQTDGLQWTVDLTRPIGQRARDVRVGGQPLAEARRYRVVTHGGMLAGIHRYDTFRQGSDVRETAEQVGEVVAAALRRLGTVSAPPLGDVTLVKGGG